MSQRIMTGISVTMAVCGFIVVGMVWSMMKQNEQVNLKMLEQLTTLSNRPAPVATVNLDQQILKQLEHLNQQQANLVAKDTDEMNQISFQLVQLNTGANPAVGFKGRLQKRGSKTDFFQVSAVSDATGKLDFGELPWGQYQLFLESPWGESLVNSKIDTIPGRDFSETIVCPAASPEAMPIQFQVTLPDWLEGDDGYLWCDFRNRIYRTGVDDFTLVSTRFFQEQDWKYGHDLVKRPDQGSFLIDLKNNQVIHCPLKANGTFQDLNPDKLTVQPTVTMLEGEYSTPAMYYLRRADLARLSDLNSLEYFSVLTDTPSHGLRMSSSRCAFEGMLVDPFDKLHVKPQALRKLKVRHGLTSPEVRGIHLTQRMTYDASPDGTNVWEIKIPDFEFLTREAVTSNDNF